jgi:hypothetical protein
MLLDRHVLEILYDLVLVEETEFHKPALRPSTDRNMKPILPGPLDLANLHSRTGECINPTIKL